jgi:hypothetical protein
MLTELFDTLQLLRRRWRIVECLGHLLWLRGLLGAHICRSIGVPVGFIQFVPGELSTIR